MAAGEVDRRPAIVLGRIQINALLSQVLQYI
eukprot:CAMPEP_0117477890 /NCGR_PEP_ID=MMETSP0784-20121206/11059_1 /TAXON_ID=39447 /ORGANISM="" /LENGTH=30 /DNA_ID= /DNA_START= /DNA_END= /DNA_ORIENTATION=